MSEYCHWGHNSISVTHMRLFMKAFWASKHPCREYYRDVGRPGGERAGSKRKKLRNEDSHPLKQVHRDLHGWLC